MKSPEAGRNGAKSPDVPTEFRDRRIEQSLKEAAEIGVPILERYHRKLESVTKKGAVDIVTRADRESEEAVFDYLRKRHPDHTLIGEESWDGGTEVPSGFTWVLDPLDGTTNYANGLDHYAFSLGVLLDGEPVAGLVVDPTRDDHYRAFRGRGAFCNKRRLTTGTKSDLRDCVIATGFPYDRSERMEELMGLFRAFLSRSRGMRRYGVAALDLALTAAGQFDAYYEGPLKPWDAAAGVLLVTEAGGIVTDYDGGTFDLFHPRTLAAGPGIHAEMVRVIRKTYKDLGLSFGKAGGKAAAGK